jgi:Nif-specific regulatory protein
LWYPDINLTSFGIFQNPFRTMLSSIPTAAQRNHSRAGSLIAPSDRIAGLRDIQEKPALLSAAAELLWAAQNLDDPKSWLDSALPALLAALGGDYVALVSGTGGRWTVSADVGRVSNVPAELLAEALDREAVRQQGPWLAAPLAPRAVPVEALVVHFNTPGEAASGEAAFGSLATVFHEALENVRQRQQHQRRIRRLETILEIAGKWNQTHDLEPLLNHMAEAATRLFGADRASIFLWDRPNHLLVGRPALAVKGGELRVPDDRGVVGQVIQTGQPRRVDAATEPEAIDHQVDAQLRYRTRTLLCVPLRGQSGELVGAFELINCTSGSFTQDDEDGLTELAAHAAVALENAQDRQKLLNANRQITDQAAQGTQLIGESPAMGALRSIIRRVADTDLAVLILGENGTGKEVVARSIHYLSRRRYEAFVAINCAAIPETLAESELFGHEKGAFTDAKDARPGKFELASGGTLFLDEIGDLSLGCQAKLLRVLEEKVMIRVGGSTPIHTDARVLAATNQDLAEMVRQKKFREDLYFRLNVVTLDIPPLRDRPGDILLLAQHFLADFCRRTRRKLPEFTPAAKKRLTDHPWPGNVRELRNLMERLAYLSSEDRIEAEDLAFILSPHGRTSLVSDLSQTLADATTRFQTEYIRRLIAQSEGNMSRAAERLGLHRSNLYRKMRQLGMEAPDE